MIGWKVNERVKRRPGGSEVGYCEQLWVSDPFNLGVGFLNITCQHLFSTRQQVVGKPDPLAGSRPLLLRKGTSWSLWRLPALLSVFPSRKSFARWHGKPLIAHRFLPWPSSRLSRYTGRWTPCRWCPEGRCEAPCEVVSGVISYFPCTAVWKYPWRKWSCWWTCLFYVLLGPVRGYSPDLTQSQVTTLGMFHAVTHLATNHPNDVRFQNVPILDGSSDVGSCTLTVRDTLTSHLVVYS